MLGSGKNAKLIKFKSFESSSQGQRVHGQLQGGTGIVGDALMCKTGPDQRTGGGKSSVSSLGGVTGAVGSEGSVEKKLEKASTAVP